ncbi:hypothetical protein SAMN05444266_102467 [Chitinophaga jiangningensis]|uniref:Tetratricopeptide repeat-containing protein n=1 Tax=Chitinophaga jiangningensis TaxID=1419482 RepID=A0A1M6YT51_9BACT|nr:hypothetical protein [Chitinophaga jiangningensis]SHL21232.1 hypothetical protein SAMN05444266_102467 [Chitinophaga jiangningensis]
MKKLCFSIISIIICFACNSPQGTQEQQAADSIAPTIGCAVPRTTDKAWYSSGKKAPLFKGLEGIDFKITTSVPEAQAYFNQGMMLAYGFNHAEAARSFFEATRLDAGAAMAYWGFAYVLGPNYNGGMEPDNFQRAYEAVVKAQALAANATPKENALIQALATRYAQNPPANRAPLDSAYAAAMKKVYDQYPSDPDVGALYAEALMDLHPWDLYDKKTKTPKPWTPPVTKVLEHLMQLNPKHPGAHHFYIHALEASATPEKALPSAKLLETLVPGAGHLLHMPSHIYINTGDYHDGSLTNVRAVEVDSAYTTACYAAGTYPLGLYPHNYHFLAATATLEGNTALAWKSATKLQELISGEIMRMPGWSTLQHYYTIPYYIAAKLSMWDTIIAMPAPGSDLVYPRAVWHYARGMAFLGKHDLAGARKEMDSLNKLSTDTILQHLTIWGINTSADLVQIAHKVLSAGISVQANQLDTAVAFLKAAVVIEDNLNYNEPPDWFFSVRHHLGAVLLKAGKFKEAEQVYRQDLKIWRKNGWALIGLHNALLQQHKDAAAQQALADFNAAWKYADRPVTASSSIVE